ncbi:conjugal transfer protein TrbJ [Citrobacter amalonaticus]|nr:conjugal transfer protein TrbJ [Citrobacter amalonaticus]
MCAKDRSQNTFVSQTDSIHSLGEMLNISSSLGFIRNCSGEFVLSSPLFDQMFLTNCSLDAWFTSLTGSVSYDLLKKEIHALSECSASISKNIIIDNFVWTVFIEGLCFDGSLYSKWIFFKENKILRGTLEVKEIEARGLERYLGRMNSVDLDSWKVFNLYAIGFTYQKISNITGLSEDKSKKIVGAIKKDISFKTRDGLLYSILYSVNYSNLAMNVIDILSGNVK